MSKLSSSKKLKSKSKKSKDNKAVVTSSVKTSKLKAKKKKKLKLAEEEEELKTVVKSTSKKRKAPPVEEDPDDVLEDEDVIEEDEDEASVEDVEESEDEDEDSEKASDFTSLDAGPKIEDVPFGNNCATCRLFVRWDDPRRDDPEWLSAMEKTKHRCPKLFGPDEYESDDPQSLVAQADDEACDKFKLNDAHAPQHFLEALNSVMSNFNIAEFNVLMLLSKHLLKSKELELKMGYRFGQSVSVPYENKVLKGKVVDFATKRGREVIVRAEHNGKYLKFAIPSVRAVEVEE